MRSPSRPDMISDISERHRRLLHIILAALAAALMLISQIAMSFLPNIELVSLFIVLFTRKLKLWVLPSIYVFALLEGILYGFGIWFINYLYVWTILFCLVYFLPKIDSPVYYAVIAGAFGLIFGALCSIPYFFIGGFGMMVSYFIAGIKFDLLHAVGNVLSIIILYRPFTLVLNKLKIG